MAPRKKDNPTHMAESDIGDTLRRTSSAFIEAQEGLEAARLPIKKAKGALKTTGVDWDIFNLFHGIRHLEDDSQRQRRIDKIRIAWQALLADKVQADLFGSVAAVSVAPAVQEGLRQDSDKLHAEAPAAPVQDDIEDAIARTAEPEAQPEGDEEAEQPADDLPPLVAAADMPSDAGTVFNNGGEAGRNGFLAEDNPHAEGSPEHALWERGRVKGASSQDSDEPVQAAFRYGAQPVDGTSLCALTDVISNEVVFRHPDAEFVAACCTALNDAQAGAEDPLTPDQVRETLRPHLVGFGVAYEGRFAVEAEVVETEPVPSATVVKFTGSAKQQRVQAYFHGYDGAAAGSDLAALTKGRRGEIKAQIEAGFADQQAGEEPRHERPGVEGATQAAVITDAPQASEQETAPVADGDAGVEPIDEGDDEPAADEPEAGERPRVGVQEVEGGKHVLVDLYTGAPLMDVNGPRTGETWAGQINTYFAGRLADVERVELVNAAKTLAMGRLLAPPPVSGGPSADVFAAV